MPRTGGMLREPCVKVDSIWLTSWFAPGLRSPESKHPPVRSLATAGLGRRRGSGVRNPARWGAALGLAFGLSIPAAPGRVAAQEPPAGGAPESSRSGFIGLHAGLLGPGASAGVDLSRRFTLRAQVQSYDHEFDRTYAGNAYTADLALSSTALLTDWHVAGPFRLTLGAVANDNELAARAGAEALQIGSGVYDAHLEARVTFDSPAPYLGLGWSTGRGRRGLGVTVDLGVLMQGAPAVSAAGEVRTVLGGAPVSCGVSVGEDGTAAVTGTSTACDLLLDLRSDVMEEHRQLTADLDEYEFYPVVALGLVYRF